ncbi:MAG: chorismate-binding protein [Burkholderiaceae bacterium]|nr:chorismate-binding protein [Burkholderiaceae bacterium]
MMHISARRTPAAPGAVAQAMALLDAGEGAYFGCDAGIAGMHPLQACLVARPLLALHVFADGLEAQGLTPAGSALLAHAALAPFMTASGRGKPGGAAIDALRAFHACLGHSPDAVLLGALGFEAHRLAVDAFEDSPADAPVGAPGTRLGMLYFGDCYLQRDAAGQWTQVTLTLDAVPLSSVGPAPAVATAPAAFEKDVAAQDDFPIGGYAQVVARALVRLRELPLVSLTLSQSFRRNGSVTASSAFARLQSVNPAPASFFVNAGQGERFFGASPDLQLAVREAQLQSFPVCGTVARGCGPVGEAQAFRELVNEEVDAASLAVCSDALRNDLAPLCVPGSLRLLARRRQMSLSTVVHTVDQLQGELRPGADAWDAIVATAAPVMVTGTPRRVALPLIEELEGSPRGWYGGMMVQVAGDGTALVGTILRAAVLRGNVVEVRCGGDLMADSDPPREERESRLKALSLWRALGMEEAAGAGVAMGVHAGANAVAVNLKAGSDPFAQALTDVLKGLGYILQDDAQVTVMAGPNALAAQGVSHTVALGDAAARLLAASGYTVLGIAPQHGRVMHCITSPEAPWPAAAFTSARYATLAVDFDATPLDVQSSWQVWARDEQARPVVLAHSQRRVVCLLMRPDSLMSDEFARGVLRHCLQFASVQGGPLR